jgi:hypothetical protein
VICVPRGHRSAADPQNTHGLVASFSGRSGALASENSKITSAEGPKDIAGCLADAPPCMLRRFPKLVVQPFCLRVFFLGSLRLTVLPTSWRVAGRRFFEPGGRPGPGLPGFGALAG